MPKDTSPTETAQNSHGFIPIPVTLSLTDEGASLFSKIPNSIKQVKNKDGVSRLGMQSHQYNATSVQKLIMNGYVEEILVSMPELLKYRKEVLDTNALVVFGVLYKKLTPNLMKMFLESNILKEYNRKNVKNPIVGLSSIDKKSAEMLLVSKKAVFEVLTLELKNDVIQLIISESGLGEEDKFIRMRSLEKFIDYIDRRIWYLYYILYHTPGKAEVREAFARMIAKYLDRTKLATHLGNLLMEFVQNAEKVHFEKVYRENSMGHKDEFDKFLKVKKNREDLNQLAIKMKQNLQVAWKMNSEHSGSGNEYRIQILVSNRGVIGEMVRKNLQEKMRVDVDGVSVADFYKQSADAEKLGAGLGMLYISYLEEMCHKEKIRFNCQIFPETNRDITTVKVDFSL